MLPRSRHPVVAAGLLALAAACASDGAAFPQTVVFDRQTLAQATSWTRDGMAAVVYVPPGETLPTASLQVGAILSADHPTARALHGWVRDQQGRSGALLLHEANGAEESCRVARSANRSFLALEVFKTGVARAVCVEAEQAVADSDISSCLNTSGCFADLCDTRWLARREALDLLAADLLTTR